MVLIYPFCGAAAILLSSLWRTSSVAPIGGKLPRLFPILVLPIALIVVSQFWSGLAERQGWEFAFDEIKYQAAGIAAGLTLLIVVAVFIVRKYGVNLPQIVGRVVVSIALAGAIGQGATLGTGWFNWPTYTMRDNAADLSTVVASNAVLSGPYAATLTQGNDMGCVIHMFGVVDVDST